MSADGDSDWTDLYYQFILGLGVPVGMFSLDAHALYAFDKWDNLEEFSMSNIEFGVWLSYSF